MMGKKKKSPEDFWREYEEKIGEKVLARSLGQYVSGWDEFDKTPGNPLWGLIMVTSGGFRFHHFPQTNWLTALAQIGPGGEAPKEKIIFIPGDSILSSVLHKESKWYKKIFSSVPPRLIIRYRSESGAEKDLLLYAEYHPDEVAEQLHSKVALGIPE